MTGYWKCPFCGAVLVKGAVGPAAMADDAPKIPEIALVECPQCGARISAQELADGLYDAPAPAPQPSETPPQVTCPKCQELNAVDVMRCARCGAPLLPGRRKRGLVAYLLTGAVLVAASVFLALRFPSLAQEPLSFPIFVTVLVVFIFVGAITKCLGRTPAFERRLRRAEANREAAPELAIADLTLALETAPEKKRPEILRQRNELLARLGRARPEPEAECPKCQARNAIDQLRCTRCGARLLPMRSMGERVAYFAGSLVVAGVLVGLALFAARAAEAPPCLASPVTLFALAIFSVAGGIRLGLGRTPAFEMHAKRAEKNKSAPEFALADLQLALDLAPERKRADILKQRGELLAALGRTEEAIADLTRYAIHPGAHGGARMVSTVIGVDLDEAAGAATEKTLDGLRNDLIRRGTLTALGYCQRCWQGYVLGEGRACPNCGRAIAEPRFVPPAEAEAALAQMRQEGEATRKGRRRGRTLLLIFVGMFLLCAGASLFYTLTQQRKGAGSATPTTAAIGSTETIFTYTCPPDWQRITPADVAVLMETSLEGLRSGTLTHVGGCYYRGVLDCKGCAKIVSAVALVSGMPGTLNDAQYQSVKEATEREMGSRLESFRRYDVGAIPGVESIHVGKSGKTKLRDLIFVPPEPDKLYMLSACSDIDAWEQFEPVFAQAVASLQFKAQVGVGPTQTATGKGAPKAQPTAPAAPTAWREPTPPRAPATPPALPAGTGTAIVTAASAQVRSGPGADYEPVGLLKKGDSVAALGRTSQGDWLWGLCPNGQVGWIAAAEVDLKNPYIIPVMPGPARTPTVK